MSKGTTIKAAIAAWEANHDGQKIADAEKVELMGTCPPIEKMDAGLAILKNCRHLALSTNNIEKISNMVGLENLKILSLGRNIIKKIEALDPVAPTLEELWISYNLLEKFAGLEKMTNLRVLFASNNKIKEWAEVERLKCLPQLEHILLAGNPLHQDYKERAALADYRMEVLKRLPGLKWLDGAMIDSDEREAALAAQSNAA